MFYFSIYKLRLMTAPSPGGVNASEPSGFSTFCLDPEPGLRSPVPDIGIVRAIANGGIQRKEIVSSETTDLHLRPTEFP